MNSWFVIKQALTAMDRVTRQWGRELRVDECGLMVLAMLGSWPISSAAELARTCGRSRQQVQRSLGAMARRGMVQPTARTKKGRAKGWTLSEHGVAFSRALSRAVAIWEEVLGSRVDLPATVDALGRVVKTMVNRPSADGWRMLVPDELRKESITAHFVLSTGAVVEEVAEAESTAAIGPAGWTAKETARVHETWGALWR